jgi:hypothetical protein
MTKKIYSIIALLCLAVSSTWADGIGVAADDLGKVLCTDGSLYATVSDATSASKTAAAMIAYIDTENNKGLAIALSDEASTMDWSTANGASGAAAHTPAVTGQTWKLPSQDEWKQMFGANGGNQSSYTGLNTALGNAGGTALQADVNYWTSTSSTSTIAYRVNIAGGHATINPLLKTQTCKVRACLEFDIAVITPTPTANANEWTFTMPDYDVEVGVVYDTELALNEADDNAATLEEWDGYEADVTLTRTLQTGGWNTLAVPFNVEAATLTAINAKLALMGGSMTVKELTGSSFENGTLTLNFGDATSMKAGTPYLVKVTPAAVNLATMPFAGAEVSKTAVTVETTAVDFVPTLGLTAVSGDPKEILFVSSGNKLLHPTTLPDNMKGFRAYFKLKGDAVNASSFTLDFGDGNTTGIQTIENGEVNSESIYDLQGRRVNNAAQKGVYIVNGKKVVIK